MSEINENSSGSANDSNSLGPVQKIFFSEGNDVLFINESEKKIERKK